MKIAIIGSGISGNVASYLLAPHHDITVYEKRDRTGGHSATKYVDYHGDGQKTAVDTGFIVYNELNYPGLTGLFSELGVDTTATDMSFAFSADNGGFEWSGQTLATVFAQKSNILKPKFWRMLRDIFKFNKYAASDYEADNVGDLSLGQWLARYSFSTVFKDRYLLPMGAAIWSTPVEQILDFPAANFLQFFYNHRLINADRPQWRSVLGGSQQYVNKLTQRFETNIRLNNPVTRVERTANGVAVTTADDRQVYDQVIFATHSDQALAVLHDADETEHSVLSGVRYLPNQVYLHRDRRLMPRRQNTWSAWNYITDTSPKSGESAPIMTVSYWMNRLQNIDPSTPLFVTLNPPVPPAEELTFGHYEYDHPQYDHAALQAQKDLPKIQGKRGVWFCGAWTGYGFHEDGLQSALRVCRGIAQLTENSEMVTDFPLMAAE